MPIRPSRLRWLAGCIAALMLGGCAHAPTAANESTRWQQARQLVLVTTVDWDSDHGELRTFTRAAGGDWQAVDGPHPVVIGRGGAAWGIGLHDQRDDGPGKREGDGRSPAGVFTLGEAFGYGPTANTSLPYAAMDAGNYCVDVSGSPYYNRIVDAREVGTDAVKDATEPMRRDLHVDGDQRYRLGFVIEHNPRGVANAGSCIFAHEWKSPDTTTAGCTAMPPSVMEPLLAWLDAAKHPIFVLLPRDDYGRLRTAWHLPTLPTSPESRP